MGVVDFFNVVAYAQVSSGVEMGVNRWNRVVSVSAVNSEGEIVLEKMSIKGQKLEEALEIVLEKTLAEEKSSASSQITVLIKKANDKPLPPGIAKKVEEVIAQDGMTDYDLIQLEVGDKEKTVYGLTVKDQVNKGQQKKDQNHDKDDIGENTQEETGSDEEIFGANHNTNPNANANTNANANANANTNTKADDKTDAKANANANGNENENEND